MKRQCDECYRVGCQLYKIKVDENTLGIKKFKNLCFTCIIKYRYGEPMTKLSGIQSLRRNHQNRNPRRENNKEINHNAT